MLADAFVILGSLLLGAVALTQILIPLIQSKPLFVSFRKSYQREKWLKQQLEETRRRMAELELEKQLADNRNELIRRQMEQMESYGNLTSSSMEDESGVNPHRDISEKER
jgi:hypothetical protein